MNRAEDPKSMDLKKLVGRPGFKKYLSNTSWIVGGNLIRIPLNLVVAVLVVRYLGPDQFGALAFATSVIALVAIVAQLGFNNTAVKELVRHPDEKPRILGTVFWIMLTAGGVVGVATVAVTSVLDGNGRDLLLIMLVSFGLLFNCADVTKFEFEARVQSKHIVRMEIAQMLLSAAMRVVLVLTGAPLVLFAGAASADVAIRAILFLTAYVRARIPEKAPLRTWQFDSTIARRLLASSWPLMLSGLALSIQLRIDQVMLRVMIDTEALGHYSAAVRVAESWLFLAVVLTTSLFPAILNAKKVSNEVYLDRLQAFYSLMLWLPLPIAGGIWLFSDVIIRLLFGEAFAAAAPVLAIYAWAGLLVFQITASSRWYLTEGYEDAILYRALSGAGINVVLNAILIPAYGIMGAAFATLSSYAFMAAAYDVLDPRGHVSFRMKLRSLLMPILALRMTR